MKTIDYQILDLETFAARLQGYERDTHKRTNVSLEVGDIKYYHGVPYTLSRKKIEYYYLLATVKSPSENFKNLTVDKIIGMIELQKSPYNENIIWLDFISVDPQYKHKGIGKQLSENMCQFLSDKPWNLQRSSPSDEGIQYIKKIIDDLLLQYKVKEIQRPQY